MAVHIYAAAVSETDLDVFGHVNNANYLRYYEQARWALLNENGLSLKDILTTRIGPVILEVDLKFKREMKARENFVIESDLADRQGRIFKIRQIIKVADQVRSEALFVASVFDMDQRKLIDPPQAWENLFSNMLHSPP